ncbi:MAG: phage portal protein [Ottowia sp.]|nr:phage portal protein [Ottowia sp.]
MHKVVPLRSHPGFDVDIATGTVRVRPPAAARPVAHAAAGMRQYAAARNTRNTYGFGGTTTSADTELHASLAALRSRSRQMVRDSGYARRARNLVVNNVVGAGVGMQAQVMSSRSQLRQAVNDSIEQAWREWCAADSCHTGGVLHFGDLERAAMAQVFEAGECLIRAHELAMGSSNVPLALELIEAERIADSIAEPGAVSPDAELRMGWEVDRRFGRPIACWIRRRHPGDLRATDAGDLCERVPASQLFHLKITWRWPQTRGEPWLHATVRKLDDMAETTQLEMTAARGSAAYFATIYSNEQQQEDDEEEDGTQVMELDPLTIRKLPPGDRLDFHAPNRPNTQLDPFLRMMLREAAAGTDISYASLSGDYSQTNYSSSRLSLLDDRDVWRVLQQWWIRSFRMPLHKLWLSRAVMARAVNVPVSEYALDMAKFEAVKFKPRGWTWVDPTKEVTAFKEAIKGGLTTLTDVIAATADGRDIEDVITTRQREKQLLAEAGIEVDTTVTPGGPPGGGQPAGASGNATGDDSGTDDNSDDEPRDGARRVVPMSRAAA